MVGQQREKERKRENEREREKKKKEKGYLLPKNLNTPFPLFFFSHDSNV